MGSLQKELGGYCLIILAIISVVLANENETVVSDGGVYVKVLGHSGKIIMSRSADIESDENRIVVEMDEIKEKDENGNDVGQGGPPEQKHSFNTFANQQFEFSDVMDGMFENISTKTFNFTANVANGALLVVDVYIFNENGTYNLSGEVTTVSEGSVKFNIRIDDWKFCGDSGVTCQKGQTNEVGMFLDFTIAIKGKGASPQKKSGGKKRTTADEYDLGSGSVVISNKVQYDDGDWVETPTGYPVLETRGSKQLFVFRFDKFSKSVLYDPQVDLAQIEGTTTTESTPTDIESNVDQIHVKVLGRSGKIQVGNRPNPSSDPNRITVEFSELKEKKANGDVIKDNKHNFNNFAKTDFTFTPLEDTVFMNTTAVKKFTFTSTLNSEGAMLETDVYIFKEDANITLDDESTLVEKGNMKFSTKIKNWKFCGQTGVASCTQNEVGAYLDFGIIIKGKGSQNKKSSSDKTDADEYDLGEGSSVVMSKKVKYNNEDWTDMASGYPMMTTQGSKQIFYIRLNNFTGSAYYDPTISYGPGDTGGGSHVVFSVSTILLLVFTYLILV